MSSRKPADADPVTQAAEAASTDHHAGGTIAARLIAAQHAARTVAKASRNEFHRYQYASAEAIILEAQDALSLHRLALVPVRTELRDAPEHVRAMAPFILHREWLLVSPTSSRLPDGPTTRDPDADGGPYRIWQDWPVVPDKGRPLDKAVAAADTAGLGYLLRSLLLLARVEPGTDLDDDARDRTGSAPPPAAPRRGKAAPSPAPRPNSPPATADAATDPLGASTDRPPSLPQPPPPPSDPEHDPEWEEDRVPFCALLSEHGLRYADVAAFLEARGRKRPSQVTGAKRSQIIDWLAQDGARAVRAWLAQKAVAEADGRMP